MENNYVLCSGDELYHWGIKGMKWGVRRYQNKDGSLTPAGQKRRDKLQAKLDKIDNKDAPKNSGKVSKKISDMTDDELREYITRKNSEKMAYSLERDIAQLNPKKVSAGEKFANELRDKVLGPAAMDAGKKLLSGALDQAVKKALGDNANDAMSKLKKEAEKAGYQQTIANAKKAAVEAAKAEREANKKEKEDPELAARKREAELADLDKKITDARTSEAKLEYQKLVNEGQAKKNQASATTTSTASSSNESSSNQQKSGKSFVDDVANTPVEKVPASQQKAGKDYVDSYDNVRAGIGSILGITPDKDDD